MNAEDITEWWYEKGSGMRPLPFDDQEEHAARIVRAAAHLRNYRNAMPKDERQTGRTVWMYDQIIDEMEMGQPQIAMIVATANMLERQMRELVERIEALTGQWPVRLPQRNTIAWNGTRITGYTIRDPQIDQSALFTRPLHGYNGSFYVDHYAAGEE
jgi:hypothetical protein